jgi:hypothetical protein
MHSDGAPETESEWLLDRVVQGAELLELLCSSECAGVDRPEGKGACTVTIH